MESNQKLIVFVVVALIIGAAIGAVAGIALKPADNNTTTDQTYSFYLYFGDDSNAKNGWYSATGSDAGAAFEKAMKDANISYEISSTGYSKGYLKSVDGVNNGAGWFTAQYVYKDTTKTAADNSIIYENKTSYGEFSYSNGWKSFSGYDDTGITFKLSESDGKIFFISPYKADYSTYSPCTNTGWMSSGPFKA